MQYTGVFGFISLQNGSTYQGRRRATEGREAGFCSVKMNTRAPYVITSYSRSDIARNKLNHIKQDRLTATG